MTTLPQFIFRWHLLPRSTYQFEMSTSKYIGPIWRTDPRTHRQTYICRAQKQHPPVGCARNHHHHHYHHHLFVQ